jgi:hypothetical protein
MQAHPKGTFMPFPRGVVDNDQLNTMQYAMALACHRLGLAATDTAGRERVAFLVTGFMRAGEHDPHNLTNYVVRQFKLPAP